MTEVSSTFAALLMIVTTSVVVTYGSVLAFRLYRYGGLERALARLILDPTRRRAFLWEFRIVAAAFVALGVATILSNLNVVGDLWADTLVAGLYSVGSLSLLFMIASSWAMADLSLKNELDLRDRHPELFSSLSEGYRPAFGATVSPYLVYPVEVRAEISNSSPKEHPDAWY